ncbi:hypothetical protein KR222_006212 [Zaprionus bogoriensis]|nr:hypothetical protein KR222_006212 [Zaprionus bogoriensis]
MWQLNYAYALVFQLLLLGSVYVTYFRSKVMTGLEPQRSLMKDPPADRLVIFAVDGLSAKSFFERGCRNVPELSEIFLQQGQVGISRSHAGSIYHQGHSALFSGFYENPIALFPSGACDTVFNRSTLSYAWGSDRLLQHFPDIHEAYVRSNDVSDMAIASYQLDEWTFNAVRKFLSSGQPHKLKSYQGLVFFVHLSGLQESNGAEMYQQNLNYTQEGIWSTYKEFEQAFPDKRTAYLLASDYVRRDDWRDEVETPFMVWGCGISNSNFSRGRSFVANKERKRLPLNVLEQIQLTPLMTAVLGLSPPVNSRGQLPTDLLNASQRFESHALLTNAFQLLEQALQLLEQHDRGMFSRYFPSHWLTLKQLDNFIYSSNLLWHQKRFLTLKEYSGNFMPVLLKCIEYYEAYYVRSLLIATACSFVGWQYLLRSQAMQTICCIKMRPAASLVRAFVILLFVLMQLQHVPVVCRCVLLLPGIIWMLALNVPHGCGKLQTAFSSMLALCCISGFMYRRLMSLFYVGFAYYNNRDAFQLHSRISYAWIFTVCTVAMISWLPSSLGHAHRYLLLASLVFTFINQTVLRPRQGLLRRNLLINGFVLLLASLHVFFSPHTWTLHLLARAYVVYVFYPRFGRQTIEVVVYNLSTLHALLCTSYEAFAIQLLALELQLVFRAKLLKGNADEQTRVLARHILVYSVYSFSVLGKIEHVHRYLAHMQFTGFGYYSALVNGMVLGLKLVLPLLMLLCIVCANCGIAWTNRSQIFQELLAMCNAMAFIFLFRIRINDSLEEICIRMIQFVVVQVLPFVLLPLMHVAHYLVRNNRMQLVEYA